MEVGEILCSNATHRLLKHTAFHDQLRSSSSGLVIACLVSIWRVGLLFSLSQYAFHHGIYIYKP